MKIDKIEYSTEPYEIQKNLEKRYANFPELTQETLDILVNIISKYPTDSDSFKFIIEALTEELNY